MSDLSDQSAREADRTEPAGPLHGVPITVKENIDLLGTPTTHGLAALAEAMPTEDAPSSPDCAPPEPSPSPARTFPSSRCASTRPTRSAVVLPIRGTSVARQGGSSGGEGAASAARTPCARAPDRSRGRSSHGRAGPCRSLERPVVPRCRRRHRDRARHVLSTVRAIRRLTTRRHGGQTATEAPNETSRHAQRPGARPTRARR